MERREGSQGRNSRTACLSYGNVGVGRGRGKRAGGTVVARETNGGVGVGWESALATIFRLGDGQK